MHSNSITEAGHQAGMINIGLAAFAVLLALALMVYGIDKYIHAQPCAEQHVTKECKR